ncbi:MAG: SAM-dependent methyltransferase [Saprospiraceae bacterium]|nr:SAM-dependent methyltransferase [Saprospiraceae bacterium]
MSLDRFLQHFQVAFQAGQLLKCSLSKTTTAAGAGLKNIYIRPVELKAGIKVAFNYRYATRDEVKNYSLEEARGLLKNLLGQAFLNAEMFTAERDFSLRFEKDGTARLTDKKSSGAVAAETGHDREKKRLLDPSAPWLHTLGITSAKGEVLASAQDKWRQINKYLETIESLLRQHALPTDVRIADMGSGKGYLTFALYDFLVSRMGMQPQITGIELRPALVEFCNKTARENAFQGLHFVATDINDYQPERLDMLIALHACDTATDLALATGIHQKAQIIVAAPCCHKQIRRDMETRNEMAPLLRFGILEERQAEILTDGIRALLLEANGYKTHVFEFISTEHTAKNVMITAVVDKKSKPAQPVLEKIAALKAGFGITEHYLERLLR